MFNSRFIIFLSTFTSVTGLTVTTDSSNTGNGAALAGDGNTGTFWHSQYSPSVAPLPHWAIVDLGSPALINGFNYLPRQTSNRNGNIGQYRIETSPDNSIWTQVANGSFIDDNSKKYVGFTAVTARYVRITALTEAGGRGQWTSAAEFGVNSAPTTTNLGQWSPVVPFPLVPAGAFLLPSGKILTFSSYKINDYYGSGLTYTATYDPATNTVSQQTVSNTGHDMFCPGISLDVNGRAIVTGGDDAYKTSILDPNTGAWITGAQMKISRGYQSSTTLSDGRIFTIGGSWSGGKGGKNGEIYDPKTNVWSLLKGCPVAPMLTADAQGIFRSDNHAWLFAWKNGYVLQAGPSKAMNWYGTSGTGSQAPAGNRASAVDSMDGVAVLYDAVAGKVFAAGGSPSYQNSDAHNKAYLITISAPLTTPTVTTLSSMTYARAFHNSVVLPDGKVFVVGGQTRAVPFSDANTIYNPELWDPATQTFTLLPPHVVPRNYHSVAILQHDARVFVGGSGLCGDSCGTNHADAEIFSPSYLYTSAGALATRPVINSVSPSALPVGATLTVVTNSAISSWSLIRFGSATHTVNTDQRRIALTPATTSGTTYTFIIPNDSGVALPGYWMLFALNSAGVPSVAKNVRITI